MIDLEALYDEADFSSDKGVHAICEKIKNMNVSDHPSNDSRLK